MNKLWQLGGASLLGMAIGLSPPAIGTETVIESSFTPPAPAPVPSPTPAVSLTESSKDIPPKIRQYAQSITVKVLAGDNSGSGILVRQQGSLYTVLTNQHVLLFGKGQSYGVVTSDGERYSATVVEAKKSERPDLGLLQFRSPKNYRIAALSQQAKLISGEAVVAAGFPFATSSHSGQELILLVGKVEQLESRSFGGGYQIGYTSPVQKGMSGGPLLNLKGQVVGINGVHKYPLWGNPYVFADGQTASAAEQKRMSQLSWAIPIQAFLQWAPEFGIRGGASSVMSW